MLKKVQGGAVDKKPVRLDLPSSLPALVTEGRTGSVNDRQVEHCIRGEREGGPLTNFIQSEALFQIRGTLPSHVCSHLTPALCFIEIGEKA